ncbi:MAG TPA: hypothetical protein VK831_02655 [Candidatus Deferrimicrobiaceae bacterium]|nr:hypothetical protein [Candidatus Deferrimicrobiaceae bacterium]
MRPGSPGWWAAKIRQALRHWRARVSPRERESLVSWLTPAQLGLFDAMHVADRRHGLDVVAALRQGGEEDPDVLVAGLLHDAGKGRTGMVPRVVYALGQAYGGWVEAPLRLVPGMTRALDRLRIHAETSARLAEGAGCSPRAIDLIRWQDAPRDPDAGERLRLADEAN